MATKKAKSKSKKVNNNRIFIILAIVIAILAVVYSLYTIIKLVIKPTDSVMVRNDTISKEESAIRVCN